MVEVGLKALPPREALAYLRSKGLAPPEGRFDYRDTWREQHAGAFVVSKGRNDDILTLLRDSIITAKANGTPMEAWRETVAPQLQDAGWWGRRDMLDPLTGEIENVQLGSMRRLRVIFDTNSRVADAAGRWAAIQRTKNAFPYLGYRQIDRPTKRPAHTRFNGGVWPVDDPVWERIYPPNGYFCMCSVFRVTQGQIDRGEYAVSPPFDLDEVLIPNERRGDDDLVPNGVTPGFDYNPGMVWLDMQSRMEGLEGHPNLPELIGAGTQLRLHVLREGFERGIYITPDGVLLGPVQATAADPYRLSGLDPRVAVPPGSDFIHSHPGESPLSRQDIITAIRRDLGQVVAVTPQGSIFAAHPRTGPFEMMKALQAFSSEMALPWIEPALSGASQSERGWLIDHGRLLWLERMELIDYFWSVSGAQGDLFDRHTGFFEDLLKNVPR